jgi:hypothetical protein
VDNDVMPTQTPSTEAPDICLILRAHAEQLWLMCEVLPTVRQLERIGRIPEDQVGAALAYLEVLWLDACQRAAESDAAHEQLRAHRDGDRILYEKACRYHAAVLRLRMATALRVGVLTGTRRGHEAGT